MRNPIRLLLFASLLLGVSSCKVQYTFTGADIPANANTVSVAFFQNNAPLANPNTGQQFTEALKDLFIAQTRLELAANNGDLRYEGSITGYDVRPVAIQGNETASLNRLTITVNVKYTNTLDEKKNFEQSFSRFADFPSSSDISSVEEGLITEIHKQLVQDVFDRSLGSW